MNYLPPNYSNATYFYPDNTGGVGSFSKSVPAQTLVTFDYSGSMADGVTINNISFLLDVQTNPQLIISGIDLVGAGNILTWIVSGGMGGITYNLSAVATLTDSTVRTDVVGVQVTGDNDMGCDPCGKLPVRPIPAGYQQASMAQNGVYATGLIRYFVSNTPPLGANVMDQWWNTNTRTLLEYITDGTSSWWYTSQGQITPAGPSSSLYYPATDGQTIFYTTLPDAYGKTILLTLNSLVTVFVNGVLYVPQGNSGQVSWGDYLVDVPSSSIIMVVPLVLDDIVTVRIGTAG